jgi:class 3 adenylate cyclase
VEARLVLGRAEADLTLDDPLVSRHHALLRPTRDALEIEDLGSLNGTWVNGERIEGPKRLEAGDVVRVGNASIEVVADTGERGTILAPVAGVTSSRTVEARRGARSEGRASLLEASSEDELRPVTALFADIVGSTTLGERLAPDEVKLVIGECVNRMCRAVEEFGGSVQAYMGDGIAALFGVPRVHEDDPERAARAALRLLANVAEYAQEIEAAWGISDFNARVGINTGEAAVGVVGAADPQAVTLGDTTNVAARLESLAEPGTIAVGEATAKAIVHRFALEPLGETTVKGRTQPVSPWRLVGTHSAVRTTSRTPLIGRDAELAQLRGIHEELTAGRGQVVLLLGEAGLGKTRLLGELSAIASDRSTWLEGHCFSYGTELVYGPFIQILRSWIGAEDGEAELAVRTKLHSKLGLLPASQLSEVMPYLARLLSLKLEQVDEERLRAHPPDEMAAAIRRAYRTWVESLASRGPVVLAIEDIHWIDSSSRELAEELLELTELTSLLLLGTTRIDPASQGSSLRVRVLTDFAHRATEVRLTPLDAEASRSLIEALSRDRDFTKAEQELVVTAAEGNPLYIEELANALAENAGLRRGQTWAATVTLPRILTPTLESLLLTRLDAVPSGARRLAQIAAIVGRSFPLRVLEHVSDGDDLQGDLAALLRADIIRELRRYPETEYVFRHGLIWQACLSTLTPGRRRELYGAVGTAFETLFAGSLDDHLEVIAHYFARSRELGKALDYLERAGEASAALGAATRAQELWRRALKVAAKIDDPAAARRIDAKIAELERRSQRGTTQGVGSPAEQTEQSPTAP